MHLDDAQKEVRNVWSQLNNTGPVQRRQVIQAYQENHEIAISEVKRLVDGLTGRTIITSDHANLIGEWLFPLPMRQYGHPRGLKKEQLREVPWLIIESGPRKVVVDSEPVGDDDMDSDVVEDRLRNLGYTH